MRTIALSDLHLPRRSSRIAGIHALAPLLAGAGRIILNGDAFDYGWSRRPDVDAAKARAEEFLAGLGAEIIHIGGNHDFHLAGRLPCHIQGGVCYTHGHLLYMKCFKKDPADLKSLMASMAKALTRVSASGDRMSLNHRLIDILTPLLSMRLCQLQNREGHARRMTPKFLRMIDGGERVDQLVLGHAHVGGVRSLPGLDGKEIEVVNTGAWLSNTTPLVTVQEDDGPAVLYRAVKRADGKWELGERVRERKVF
jgi:UDP-2,3-diacylglucosamine pyrophosphatase LpxH